MQYQNDDLPNCRLCKHNFKWHQQVAGALWYCEAGNCACDEFFPDTMQKAYQDYEAN